MQEVKAKSPSVVVPGGQRANVVTLWDGMSSMHGRVGTPTLLNEMREQPVTMTANRVTINSPIVTTEPRPPKCYICRQDGHTASCCYYSTVDQMRLRPVWCGAQEQARRSEWISSFQRGPYPFNTSAPFLPLRGIGRETQYDAADYTTQQMSQETNDGWEQQQSKEALLLEEGQRLVERREPPTTTKQPRSRSATSGDADEVVEDLRRRRPSEVRPQQVQSWQQQEERGKELQRQGQALLVEARNLKKKADLEKEVQKDEKAAEEARERAEKSRKRLREMK